MSEANEMPGEPVAANVMLRRVHTSTRRERDILVALSNHPGSTVAQLAESLALHVNTVREHLNSLRRNGLLTIVEPAATGVGRPELIYYPITAIPGQPLKFLSQFLRVFTLLSDIDDAKCIEIGRAWAKDLIDEGVFVPGEDTPFPERLHHIMRMMGFAPIPHPDSSHLNLHTCPFRAADEPVPELMCRLHAAMATALADAETTATGRPLRISVRRATGPGQCSLDVVDPPVSP